MAYQEVITKIIGEYCHKNGKYYVRTVCKSYKSPSQFNIDFIHVSKVKTKSQLLPVNKWDMAYPNEIVSLQAQVEYSQIALCGPFSTEVKDAKKHQWHHVQTSLKISYKVYKWWESSRGCLLCVLYLSSFEAQLSNACVKVCVADDP